MERIVLLIIALVILLCFAVIGAVQNHRMKKYVRHILRQSYGKANKRVYGDGEYVHMRGYANNHLTGDELDDITWNDLDMDAVFARMNYSLSSAGDEYLYYLLRNPSNQDMSMSVSEDKIRYYMEHEEERLLLQEALYDCGRTGKYSVYDYLNNLDNLAGQNSRSDLLILLLYVIAIAVMCINLEAGILAICLMLFVGGFTYFAKKRRIEPYIVSIKYVFRVLRGAKRIAALSDEIIAEERAELMKLTKNMKSFERFSGFIMVGSNSANILDVLFEYMRLFLHLDIIKFFQMVGQIKTHWDDIDKMLTIIGRIDTMVTIGGYRMRLGEYCTPEFNDGNNTISGTDVYHPLLENPVSNDVKLSRGIILTGSNASGKSTFLKTIAVNAILAQCINTVCAKSYSAPHYRVYTSLALQDSIFAGESYYMTEIKSLKRILDAGTDDATPILACVDEVLRGTNTIERISASSVILEQLSTVHGIILAATHDLELADMLREKYDNYHFSETIEGDDISFSYKLHSGKATTRNAIKLLEIMGYDSAITSKANEVAARYEKTGSFV